MIEQRVDKNINNQSWISFENNMSQIYVMQNVL